MWIYLTPREAQLIDQAVVRAGTPNAMALVEVQAGRSNAYDLEVTPTVLEHVRAAAQNYHDGGERVFKAILAAAGRHAEDCVGDPGSGAPRR